MSLDLDAAQAYPRILDNAPGDAAERPDRLARAPGIVATTGPASETPRARHRADPPHKLGTVRPEATPPSAYYVISSPPI